MTRTFSLLILLVSFGSGIAAEYGPIFQWNHNPCTTTEVHWITTREGGDVGTMGKWLLGAAGFGYGDDDDQTVLKDMRGKYRSVYIRRPYVVPEDSPDGADLMLSVRYDDAFVAYLDGKEVAREGVKGSGGKVEGVEDHEADVWETFKIGVVKPGQKGVIALEGHNVKMDSSDFTLRPRVDVKTKGKVISVVKEGAKWSYLTGAPPPSGWMATTKVDESASGSVYEVAYRPAGVADAEWQRSAVGERPFGPTQHLVHSTSLVGLEPGTRYDFKIARHGKLIGTWQFETAPGNFVEGMTFVAGGDMFHTRAQLDAMNKRAGLEDPLFALLGGDLAYANGTNSAKWLEWVDSWSKLSVAPDGRAIPMILAIGNHEVKGVAYRPTNAPSRSQAPYYYSLFSGQENGARTVTDFGNYLTVLTLDSGHTQNVGAQTEWLNANLEARPKIPRLFVCYHRPAWGTGVKGDAIDIRKEWSPLFEKYKVDAVFENDHHVYKRTHPIREGKVDDKNGVIYLGDGSWGVNVRNIPTNWKTSRPWLAEAKSLNHLIKVTMKKDGIQYQGMTVDGEVFDATTRPLRR